MRHDETRPASTAIFVDAHVHIHRCEPVADFLDRALANLKHAALAAGKTGSLTGVLMLAEIDDQDCFKRYAQAAKSVNGFLGRDIGSGWSWHCTDEPVSLIASKAHDRLIFVAGRQLTSAERLEVLVFGWNEGISEALPVVELLTLARGRGALCVLPWGVGKWLSQRGLKISALIRAAEPNELFIGDVSGRPGFWPNPPQFTEAHQRGLRVLRGTDPLAFPWEADRVGKFGFWTEAPLDSRRPAQALMAILRDRSMILHPYGSLERPWRFFRNQLGMQLLMRRGRHAQGA